MIRAAYSIALFVLVSVALSSCANTSDSECGKDKAMAQLSNLGMLALYFRDSENSFSEEERKGLLKMASSMAVSAAIEGVPGVDEMRGIHEDGILWLMDHRKELPEFAEPSVVSLIDETYSPMIVEIVNERKNMAPTAKIESVDNPRSAEPDRQYE